jgi:hypothetical protein
MDHDLYSEHPKQWDEFLLKIGQLSNTEIVHLADALRRRLC